MDRLDVGILAVSSLSLLCCLCQLNTMKRLLHLCTTVSYLLGHAVPPAWLAPHVGTVARTMCPVFLVGFLTWTKVGHLRRRHQSIYMSLLLYMCVSETSHVYLDDVQARIDLDLALFLVLFVVVWRRCHWRAMTLVTSLVAIYVSQCVTRVYPVPPLYIRIMEGVFPLCVILGLPGRNQKDKQTCCTYCCRSRDAAYEMSPVQTESDTLLDSKT